MLFSEFKNNKERFVNVSYLANLMKIYLTGYMASGKTFIGRRLAQRLDIPFFDLDACIVERYNQPISKIFASEGEAAFRKKETETLRSIPNLPNAIISCGGGTFCFSENRDWIKEQGISIYLQVSVDTLVHRLSSKKENRPIIKANNGTEEELRTFIKMHLASRKADYEQANIVYSSDGSGEEIVVELSLYFRRFLKS